MGEGGNNDDNGGVMDNSDCGSNFLGNDIDSDSADKMNNALIYLF